MLAHVGHAWIVAEEDGSIGNSYRTICALVDADLGSSKMNDMNVFIDYTPTS